MIGPEIGFEIGFGIGTMIGPEIGPDIGFCIGDMLTDETFAYIVKIVNPKLHLSTSVCTCHLTTLNIAKIATILDFIFDRFFNYD